jgi:hypothetical protein
MSKEGGLKTRELLQGVGVGVNVSIVSIGALNLGDEKSAIGYGKREGGFTIMEDKNGNGTNILEGT